MLSLLELVSQNQPHFQTHQALLVIGLQNDLIQPDGKLPVNTRSGFLDRIHQLIPTFRQQSSNVIWIKTLYEADRLVDPMAGEADSSVAGLLDGVESSSTDDDDDLSKGSLPQAPSRSSKHKQRALDLLKRVSARRRAPREGSLAAVYEDDDDDEDELFLRQSAKTGPACLPNTTGSEFVESILPRIEQSDTVVQTTHYSAFQGTSLLLILRARLVTELYICGGSTNVSVLATVMDAARHGIRINVVGDCLGFRKQSRHDMALKRMVEFFDANILTSSEVSGQDLADEDAEQQSQDNNPDEERLQDLVDKMRLTEANAPRQIAFKETPHPTGESPTITINGQQRRPSHASITDSRTTLETAMTDEQFAEKLTQGAKLDPNGGKQPAAKQSLVKSKIRMRSRSDKGKRTDENKPKAESSKKAEPKGDASPNRTAAEKATDQPPKSPKTASVFENSRSKTLSRAGSISKLRDSFSGTDRSLKLSASQPALSSSHSENKDKSTTSRVRLALSRSPKSESGKVSPQPPASPAKIPAEQPDRATTQTSQTSRMGKAAKLKSLANLPVLRPGDRIAEGDSRIIYDFFSPELYHPTDPSKPLKDLIFTQIYNEVRWQKMLHQQGEVPRLVCCQGEFGADGSMPVYRHPTDQTLPLLHFSPKVKVIRKQAEKLVGHPLNHVLIQLYRSGNDYISEHSDKTLDIVKGSSIVNVSFGAQRTMRLRTKKSAKAKESEEGAQRDTQRVAMPHNSMFVLGLKSNEKWLHGIMADKRLPSERNEAENAYSGIRISLTFRHIGTFLDTRNQYIWGQGATSKDQRDACDVINDDEEETERLVRAFSRENQTSEFDWDDCYGDGSDVLHLHAPPRDLPILFESYNEVETKMIKIFLAEQKMEYIVCPAPALEKQYEVDRQVSYRDNDANHTEIVFAMPIVLYLDRYYPLDADDRGRYCTSQSYFLYIQISAMMKFWHNREVPTYMASFLNMLEAMEESFSFGPGSFIAGRRFSIGDCGMWPALDELVVNWDGWSEMRFPKLSEYYKMLWRKKKSVQKFREVLPPIKKYDKGKARAGEDEEEL